MPALTVERRAAPRFATSCVAELASKSSLVRVQIPAKSVTGCRVEILRFNEDMPTDPGSTGILNIKWDAKSAGLLIPVALRVVTVGHGRWNYGLQFRSLVPRLGKQIIVVMERIFVP